MTQLGGSATMNGVLYQLLGTAHWAGKIHLSASTEDGDWTDVRLVIEPSGGGGDTRIASPQRCLVEQWKSKCDGGAWSLRKVISEVFPDLYRAVNPTPKNPETEFRFVTEGHRGRWIEAEQFFAELRSIPIPDDPFAALDDRQSIKFFPDKELTKRGLFRHIVQSLQRRTDIGEEPETECAKKLWYLLGRFRIRGDQTIEKLTRELNGFLRPLVDYNEQVESKRRELCAALLELASDGNATFTPQELLAKVNLNHTSFSNWARSRSAVLTATQRTLQRQWQYCSELDVRSLRDCPANSSVCVLAGESGQGKTWRLASLALDAFAQGGIAVAVRACGDAEQDLLNAATIVWRDGFQREGPTDLDLVARKRNEFLPELLTPWLTVCVDDVQSTLEARSLVERDWAAWGIRLAMTVLLPVAQALKTQYGESISITPVDDFSGSELREYLEINGYDWGRLPQDLRMILRRPLFAKLYCDTAEESLWRPSDEYTLFSRYWRRIMDHRDQADHPGDTEAVRQLAGTFLGNDVVYPWLQSDCVRCGISEETQTRLESVGWLRRLDDNRIEITHDRLLNWAVAETIVSRRRSRDLSIGDVADSVSRFSTPATRSVSGRMLGYVPLDVCWLMGEPSVNLTGDLPRVIEAMENETSIWYSEELYEELLPSLGPRIIGPMVARVRAVVNPDEAATESAAASQFLSRAAIQIGKQHPNETREWGCRMLDDECETIQKAGLNVLKHFPTAAVLDKLWELHKVNCAKSASREKKVNWWVEHDRSFAALRSCVLLDTKWLERQIAERPGDDGLTSELAFLVANVRGAEGASLWRRVKGILFSTVPDNKARCLVGCIRSHADRTEIARLETWLQEGDNDTRATAFAALVYLAPERALASLRVLDSGVLYGTRTWWRPGLLLRVPEETRNQI